MVTKTRVSRDLTACAVCVCGILAAANARGASDADRVPPARAVEHWGCVFADEPVNLRYCASDDAETILTGNWVLTVGERIVSRGSMQEDGEDEGGVVVAVDIPPVREGVVVTAQLKAELQVSRSGWTTVLRTLHLFPRDPFYAGRARLADKQIHLFDPLGATAEVFDRWGLRFRRWRTVAALANIDKGVLVVGEGVKWSSHGGLVDAMLAMPRRGVTVLSLAPAAGALPVAHHDQPDRLVPVRFALARADIVQQWDKRFDTDDWQGGRSVISSVTLAPYHGGCAAVVSASEAGWPWLEWQFADTGGATSAMVVCGFNLIAGWDTGPMPRFLLAHVLERLLTADHPNQHEEN